MSKYLTYFDKNNKEKVVSTDMIVPPNIITNGPAVKTGRKVDGKDEYVQRLSKVISGSTASISFSMTNKVLTRSLDSYISDTSTLFYANCIRWESDRTVGNYASSLYLVGNKIQFNTVNCDRTGYTLYVNVYYTNK